jgi:hypothetical protein
MQNEGMRKQSWKRNEIHSEDNKSREEKHGLEKAWSWKKHRDRHGVRWLGSVMGSGSGVHSSQAKLRDRYQVLKLLSGSPVKNSG